MFNASGGVISPMVSEITSSQWDSGAIGLEVNAAMGPSAPLADSGTSTPLANALVGKFVGRHPNFVAIRKGATAKWVIKGSLSISALPKGHFLFSFSLLKDCVKILSSVPWLFRKQHLQLRKWCPGLKPDSALSSAIPTCVHLPGLPLEYWDKEIITVIANSFGQFIVVDSITR
ncbi:hypothetical protein SUGI_0699880 [Cryptomeria japonica]|nr:hypothetical protein SUGI_0699880 [Cryptomeria japonica]